MKKYHIVHSSAGSYGEGEAFKIYSVEVEDNKMKILEPIAGVYFSLRRNSELRIDKDDILFNTFNEAKSYIVKSSIKKIFDGKKIYDLNKLIKSLRKVKI